jgi:hypothetical protein
MPYEIAKFPRHANPNFLQPAIMAWIENQIRAV